MLSIYVSFTSYLRLQQFIFVANSFSYMSQVPTHFPKRKYLPKKNLIQLTHGRSFFNSVNLQSHYQILWKKESDLRLQRTI